MSGSIAAKTGRTESYTVAMILTSKRVLAAAGVLLVTAGVSSAQVRIQFAPDGLVTLSAQNVDARTILAEWARLGGTTIVNGNRVVGGPLTLELAGVTERQALDVILREVPGYMLALRETTVPGQSRFDRIMVVPVTATPRPAVAATFQTPPPAFSSGPADQDDFALGQRDDAARRGDDLAQRAREAAETVRRLNEQQQNRVGIVSPGIVTTAPPPPFAGPEYQQRPATPPPGPTPGNPFMPTPGSATPGTIAPVPSQQQQQQQQQQNQPRPVQ
jgi:hypothetical protein